MGLCGRRLGAWLLRRGARLLRLGAWRLPLGERRVRRSKRFAIGALRPPPCSFGAPLGAGALDCVAMRVPNIGVGHRRSAFGGDRVSPAVTKQERVSFL
jgi:hypothetical protein